MIKDAEYEINGKNVELVTPQESYSSSVKECAIVAQLTKLHGAF